MMTQFRYQRGGTGFLILLELAWLVAPSPRSLLSVLLYYLVKFLKLVSLYLQSLGTTVHQWKRKQGCGALLWGVSATGGMLSFEHLSPRGRRGRDAQSWPSIWDRLIPGARVCALTTPFLYLMHSHPTPIFFSSASPMGCAHPVEGVLVTHDQGKVPSEHPLWQSPSYWAYTAEHHRRGPILRQLIA